MELANASLLDEATAAAEAMAMCRRLVPKGGPVFLVDPDCHPQTIDVVRTRAEPLGIEVVVGDPDDRPEGTFGVLVQYPGSTGQVRDHAATIAGAHEDGALVTVAADLLGLVALRPPGEIGADVVVGSSQRFGVPLGFGGPTPASWPPATPTSGPCPAAWWACRSTPPGAPPTASPCRPASSTSGARRPPATSAPPRSCWRSWPASTPPTTAPTGCAGSPSGSTASPRSWLPG